MSLLTSDLFDAVEGVLEGVQGAGVALGLALYGQPDLELLQGLHELLLGAQPRRLVAAAARRGGGVLLRAGGEQAVGQRAAGRGQALGGGAGGGEEGGAGRERGRRL